MTTRARWLLACAALVVLVEIIYGTAPAAEPSYTRRDQAWDNLFQAYGNRSDAWSGGDGAQTQAATQLQTGVSAAFSVTDVNGTDVLMTSDGSDPVTSLNAVAYYAPCPTGFAPGDPRHPIFEPHLPGDYLAYAYQVVPQFSSGSEVLVSYSVDTVELGQNFTNVSIYRPRFLDVRLPGIPGPAGHVIRPPP